MLLTDAIRNALRVGMGNRGLADLLADEVDASMKSGGTLTTQNIGAKNGATVSAVEYGDAVMHKTVLTLTATPISLNDTNAPAQGGGVKIYDFPEGVISILGGHARLTPTTTSAIAGTLNASKTLQMGVGSITYANAATNGTLTVGEQDIINQGTMVSSATVDVAGTAGTAINSTPKGLNGSATAADAYLNVSVPTATDIDADATITVTGTITIYWMYLGDPA